MTVALVTGWSVFVDRSNRTDEPAVQHVPDDRGKPSELEGISPLNPKTFPRAEDDEETFAHSPEFHDLPDPGPNAGRKD
jgi:hypothetical protein